MKRIKHSSIGDYITTLSFFGLTILSFVKANEAISEDNLTKASILYLLSAIFFSSALRFTIARIFYSVHKLLIEQSDDTKENLK